jgi:hypothetical protein
MRLLTFIAILLISCQSATENAALSKPEMETAKPSSLDHQEVPEKVLTLKTAPTDSVNVPLKENLFGRFFCDRAEFFVIKQPLNLIYSVKAESITLFYLDGELRQSKYILTADISSSLINELGKFKISGHDFRNRDVVAMKKVLNREDKLTKLNAELDNYELNWTIGDREIRYRVNARQSFERFTYVEKIKTFEKELRQIEQFCF